MKHFSKLETERVKLIDGTEIEVVRDIETLRRFIQLAEEAFMVCFGISLDQSLPYVRIQLAKRVINNFEAEFVREDLTREVGK